MRIILLPGLDGTGQLFAPLLRKLPADFDATVVSYPTDELQTYDALRDQVSALLPEDKPYLILAESFSGPIAIQIAAASPPKLRGLILCASFAQVTIGSMSRMFLIFLSRFLFSVTPPRCALRYFLAGSDAPEELLSSVAQAISSVSPSVLGQRMRMALAADERKSMRDVSVPILYLLPTQDHLLCRRNLQVMLGRCDQMTVTPIVAPHLLLQRHPDLAISTIVSWLRSEVTRCQ